MRLTARADFDYGNTRLRARRGALLGSADYERLVDADIDALLGVLEDPMHATDVDVGRQRPGGLQGLHEAIRTHLGRSLEQMRSFYSGRARELVDLLLSRFDTHNVVTVIRAVAHRDVTTQDPRRALVPVGWLSGSLATEALRAHELAAVIDLFIRSTPSPEQSRTLQAALREYERTEDLAALERTVVANHAARVATTLARAGPSAATMLRFAQREIDDRNLLIALRLRDALASGAHGAAAPGNPLLPGGSIPTASFTTVGQAPAPGVVLAALGRAARGRWLSPLQRWAASGDLPALHRTLERKALTDAAALFATGNPLAIDVPLAFSAAAQAQAANLRLLGEATVRGISAEVIRRELLWPQEQP
jgi:V/A-type H+/Na+-transporting ATPase subunit C